MPKLKTDFSNLRGGIDLYIGIENNNTSLGMSAVNIYDSNTSMSSMLDNPIKVIGIKEGLTDSNNVNNSIILQLNSNRSKGLPVHIYSEKGKPYNDFCAYIDSIPYISFTFTKGSISVTSTPAKFHSQAIAEADSLTDNFVLTKVVVS